MFAKALLVIQQTFTNPYNAPNCMDTKMDKPSLFPRGIQILSTLTSSTQIRQGYLEENIVS